MAAREPQGRYQVLNRLASGGMAEVFLSRMAGPQGFERLVALKKVRSRLTEDPRFVERLVSEARIMVRLSHGNICQVLDFGVMDGQYFLAMEYVSGCDLSVILHGLSLSKEAFPPVLAAYICAEICRGLDYAHRRSDEAGRPLGVVHRDVTPENVLISHDGEVKLTDFGISMARGLGTPDDAEGVVVGKAAYLAPEQLTGTSGDARTDVFSTGILLWEMLVGRPLFRRAGQRETIDAVLHQPIVAPSRLRPEVPPELDAVALKALARKPADRYASAAAMLEEVSKFIAAKAPGMTGAPLAELVARLSPRTMTTDEALHTTEVTVPHEVVSLATSDVPPSARSRSMPSRPSLPAVPGAGARTSKPPPPPGMPGARTSSPPAMPGARASSPSLPIAVAPREPTGAVPARPSTMPFEAPAPRKSRFVLPVAVAAAFLLAVVGVVLALRPEPQIRATPMGGPATSLTDPSAATSALGPAGSEPPRGADGSGTPLGGTAGSPPPILPIAEIAMGGSPNAGASPGSTGAGQTPGSTGAGASPGSTGAGQTPGSTGAGQTPGSTGAGASPGSTGAGQTGAGAEDAVTPGESPTGREPTKNTGSDARRGEQRTGVGGSVGGERPPPRSGEGGFINVNARPWGKVYVDGRLMADETPARLPVGAGSHVVKVYFVTAARYSPARQVTVDPGQTRGMFFELQEAP